MSAWMTLPVTSSDSARMIVRIAAAVVAASLLGNGMAMQNLDMTSMHVKIHFIPSTLRWFDMSIRSICRCLNGNLLVTGRTMLRCCTSLNRCTISELLYQKRTLFSEMFAHLRASAAWNRLSPTSPICVQRSSITRSLSSSAATCRAPLASVYIKLPSCSLNPARPLPARTSRSSSPICACRMFINFWLVVMREEVEFSAGLR